MDRASEIKRLVTMQDIIRKYGFETNRSGFMRCPFHRGDHTASLKIYPGDRGWCCFGCRKGGTVIDFVMEHDGLKFDDACRAIDGYFGLGLYHDMSLSQMRKSKREREQREREKAEKERKEAISAENTRFLCAFHRFLLERNGEDRDIDFIEGVLNMFQVITFDVISLVDAMSYKYGGFAYDD